MGKSAGGAWLRCQDAQARKLRKPATGTEVCSRPCIRISKKRARETSKGLQGKAGNVRNECVNLSSFFENVHKINRNMSHAK